MRYSDADLAEFKEIILQKMEKAKKPKAVLQTKNDVKREWRL